jgi:hypothetical protein
MNGTFTLWGLSLTKVLVPPVFNALITITGSTLKVTIYLSTSYLYSYTYV